MKDRGEALFNILIFLSSIYLFHVSRSFPKFQSADMLGPAIWPQCILAAIIVLTGLMLIRNLIELFNVKKNFSVSTQAKHISAPLSLLIVMALSLASSFAIEYFGFLITIFVYQILLLYILRIRKIVTLIAFPVGLTISFYLIFLQLLNLPLSRGEGIFLQFSRLFY